MAVPSMSFINYSNLPESKHWNSKMFHRKSNMKHIGGRDKSYTARTIADLRLADHAGGDATNR